MTTYKKEGKTDVNTGKYTPPRFKHSSEVIKSFNDNQKAIIIAYWDKISLMDLVQKVFNDPTINGQSMEARGIKQFLIEKFGEDMVKNNVKTSKYIAMGKVEKPTDESTSTEGGDSAKGGTPPTTGGFKLTDDQVKMVRKNAHAMTWIECARLVFNNPALTQLHKEAIAVYREYKAFNPAFVPAGEDVEEEQYKPATSISRLVVRVNRYIFKSGPDKKFLDPDHLKQNEQRNLNSLLNYMNNFRFVYQMNQYQTKIDRELFESSYIEFLYSKPDCVEEDIHNYISLCSEIVNMSSMERTIQLLNTRYYEILTGKSDEKLSVTLAETMDKMRAKQADSKKKYTDLMGILVEDRAKRTDTKIGGATLYNMVALWKQEETRKKMIALAEKRSTELDEEVERLSSIDSLKAEIYGLDEKSISR